MNAFIETDRLILRMVDLCDAEVVQQYLLKNRKFLAEWEPIREDSYFELSNIDKQIEDRKKEIEKGSAIAYYIYLKSKNELIGNLGITNIVYGSFLSGFLGYKLSEEYINNGYMTESLGKVIEFAFTEKGLHRIEANVMPRNIRSKRVLEKLGFINEGTSPRYLRINGTWEDHEHYVKLNSAIK